MNTTQDLRAEFDRLAGLAPDTGAIRAEVAAGAVQRGRRRAAVWAVAASVVVVAGGIIVGSAMVQSDPAPARPAAPAVVDVPEIPLPEGTALIRHQLEPVTSPVTATAPKGLTGVSWTHGPSRLSVAYFDPAQPGDLSGAALYGAAVESDRPSAGYVITDGANDEVTAFGPEGAQDATADIREITVAGHAATLTTADDGALDALGFPATERISWQLADGRFIHVWTVGVPTRDSSPSSALVEFAESIREEPTTLRRTVGIGLTLPGFTVDSSMNTEPVMSYMAGSLWLCRDGVDPLDPEAVGVDGSSQAPMERGCIVASVLNVGGMDYVPTDLSGSLEVDGREVRVLADSSSAMADAGRDLVAVVAAPAEERLPTADLAALAASITVASDIDVHPMDTSGSDTSGSSAGSGWSSGSSAAEPAVRGEAQSHPAPRSLEIVDDGAADYAVNPEARTVAVQIAVRNAADDPIDMNAVALTAAGVTQQGVEVRLDNLPSDADTAFQAAVLPAMMAPGAQVRLKVTLHADECPLPGSVEDGLELAIDYSYDGGDGQIGMSLPADGWAGALDAACR